MSDRREKDRRRMVQRVSITTTVKQKLEDNHITCQSSQTISHNIQFFIDSGSDLNLIKLSALKYKVLINEHTNYQLKGITDHFVKTLGSILIQIQIGDHQCNTEFHVVPSSFPIRLYHMKEYWEHPS